MQQKSNFKESLETQKFNCHYHPDFQLQTIFFGHQSKQSSRFLCQECLIEATQELKNLNVFAVPISKFLNKPDIIVDKILSFKSNELLADETDIINNLQKNIDRFEELLTDQVQEMRQNLTNIQFMIQIRNLKNEILSSVDVSEICNGIQNVLQMDSHQGTKQFEQLEIKLDSSSVQFQQMRDRALNKIHNNQRELINKLHQNFTNISQGVDQISKIIMKQLTSITTACIPDSIFDEIKEFPEIHQLISDGKKAQYQLVYQGSRDGLNPKQYWLQCIKLSNLFQYNKKEIYKQKNPKYAVYCKYEYGPTYGDGYDLFIGEDFNNKGYSKGLGCSYDISNYKITDKSSHIFGGTTPQLQECKVYKVTFG